MTPTEERSTSQKQDIPASYGVPQMASSARTSVGSDTIGSRFIVVMGVSGTGKSTLGAALGEALHLPFIDGDDLHPAANIAKMARGEPLDDVDREPWLVSIRRTAVTRVWAQMDDGIGQSGAESGADGSLIKYKRAVGGNRGGAVPRLGVIVACSALKKGYRAVLRGEGSGLDAPTGLETYFVYLKGERDVLMARMLNRQGHFMKACMLESQLDALENPEGEPGVVSVSVEMSTEEQVQRVVGALIAS